MPAKTAFILGAIPLALQAHEYGPPSAYTGAPGDNKTSCIASGCHSGTVNSGPGNVRILLPSGNTGTYAPGQSLQLLVQITDATKAAYGFQMTARMGTGNTTQAGDFTPADKNTFVQCTDGTVVENLDSNPADGLGPIVTGGKCPAQFPVEYIQHDLTGYTASLSKTPVFTYTMNWTPPATASGTVTLYVAANCGPGNPPAQTPTNVYTSTLQLTPAAAVSGPTIANVQDAESARTSVVPGEWVAIYGQNLSGTTRVWTAGDFNNGNSLPANLSGVSVQFSGLPAAVYYISPSQIDVQAPSGISGTVPVVVTSNGAISASFNTTVAANAPSLFFYAGGATLYPAATHVDGSIIGDPAVTPGTTKARAGETIVLYVNGIASSPSGTIIGAPIAYSDGVTVTVGALDAAVGFAGLVAAGEYQLNVTMPNNIAAGNYPVIVKTQGQSSGSGITLPVGP